MQEKTTGKKFAAKAFSKKSLLKSEKSKQDLVNEINLMRKVKSNHLVSLEAVYETPNSVYIVQEYLEGSRILGSNLDQLDS